MNRKSGTLTGLALLCTAAVMATAVGAQETRESVTVRYVAGDLASPESAEVLYRRLRQAAKHVCHEPNLRELAEYRLYRECFDRAVDAAVAQVDSSTLTALHQRKTHSSAG